MAGHAELRVDGDVHLLDPADLEEGVRRARVPPNALISYPPWTGEAWTPVTAVPQLADALDAPDARFASRFLAPPSSFLTPAVVAVLVAGGVAQWAAGSRLMLGDGALIRQLSLGWETTVVAGNWWTPWSAALLHTSWFHLLGNLTVVAYCGWRCERAVGAIGTAMVASAAMLGGTVAVCAFSALPCVGASILAFGLWGGQFGIGWRYGASIPENRRAHYGGGTVLITLPILGWSLVCPHVSFVGHLGGWLGGAAAAVLLPVPVAARRGEARAAVVRGLAIIGALVLLLPVFSATAPSLAASFWRAISAFVGP